MGIRVAEEAQRLVQAVPVVVRDGPAFEFLLDPEEVEVVVRGAAARLDALGLDALDATVAGGDVAGLAPGESRRVPVVAAGVPDLLTAVPVPDWILVIRPLAGWQREP